MFDCWASLTDPVLLMIFLYLRPSDLSRVSRTCKNWHRVACDETVWQNLVKSKGKTITKNEEETWKQTYKRITYHVPSVLSKELKGHNDEIFAVGFSPSGKFLATAANDGCIKIWDFDDLDSCPKSRRLSGNYYTNYVEFNQSETLLLVNAVKRIEGNAAIVILTLAYDDLPLVCALAEPFIDFRSTWFDDSSFLGTVNSWDRDRLEIYKCEIPDLLDTKEEDIEHLCTLEKHITFLFDIEDEYTEHHMIKMLDVATKDADDRTFPVESADKSKEEKLFILFNGGVQEMDKCGVYFYHISSEHFGERELPPVIKSVLGSDCLGVWLSPDRRYLCVNTRSVENVDYNVVDDDGNLDDISYSLDITMKVYDLHSDPITYKSYHGSKAVTGDYCCFMIPSANERFIASGSEKGEVLIWDHDSSELLAVLTHIPEVIPKGSVVNAVTFHPRDPEVLVSVGDDHNIKVWKSQNRINNCHKILT